MHDLSVFAPQRWLRTRAEGSTILVRLLLGLVFLPEGIQKLVYPMYLGATRFAHFGFPDPALLAGFVGVVEIVCGTLILLGLATRPAALVLILDMLVAITTTKIPILFGGHLGMFHSVPVTRFGLGSMLHEWNLDMSMLLGNLYLLIAGAGQWSLDARLSRRHSHHAHR